MVSTYLSYDLIVRDMKSSLKRVAGETEVARDARYYRDNIGKVTSIDEFLKNDRLYAYAMTAHGLEDMIYAKGFMKKVLESDPNNNNSYINRLADDRYRKFAAAFHFSGKTGEAVAQTAQQEDEMIGLYNTGIADAGTRQAEDMRYYDIVIDQVKNVDELLNNDRLRYVLFTAFGVDEKTYSRSEMRNLLSSDSADPGSYINTVWGARATELAAQRDAALAEITVATSEKTALEEALKQPDANVDALNAEIGVRVATIARNTDNIASYGRSMDAIGRYYAIADAYDFNADGTVSDGATAQSAQKKKATEDLYVFNNPRVTPAAALLNQKYFEEKIATVTKASDLLNDPRLYSYIRTAFGLTGAGVVPSTIESILTSDRDPENAASYVNMFGKNKPGYRALLDAFNFQPDGTLPAGVPAQTAEQTALTSNYYMSAYNDKDDENDAKAIAAYKKQNDSIDSVDKFLATRDVYNFALRAVGLDPAEVSKLTVKYVMTSDLNDPKSYVYRLKDERYVKLARAFNFNGRGQTVAPLLPQSEATVADIAKSYIVQKTRFTDTKARSRTADTNSAADAAKLAKVTEQKSDVRKKAEAEAKYYTDKIDRIKTASEFLKDRRLVNVVLVAKGLDPAKVTDDDMKRMFASDLNDPKSFANTQKDYRFAEIVASFNFGTDGKLTRAKLGTIQEGGDVLQTQNLYIRQALETREGENNAGVRLALYFERMATTMTSAYDILGDKALLEVFRTIHGLPQEFSNMKIEQQKTTVEKYMKLEDLKDPEKVSKLVRRFTIMYDLDNQADTASPVSILTGSGSSGISSDTLFALTQLRAR